MDERKEVGNSGEEHVCSYLEDRGHNILERNYRAGHLEIDIISIAADGIHFVEVKTRRPPMQALPQESVTPLKQKRICTAAARYLNSMAGRRCRLSGCECHFDVAAVIFEKKTMRIEYIPDAFIPLYI